MSKQPQNERPRTLIAYNDKGIYASWCMSPYTTLSVLQAYCRRHNLQWIVVSLPTLEEINANKT